MKNSVLLLTVLAISLGFTSCATSARATAASSRNNSRIANSHPSFDRYYDSPTQDWKIATNG